MWCRNASNQLSALVDGELAPARELAVRSHVESCPRCSEELTRMHSLVQVTRCIPMEAVPAGLYTRTLTRLAYVHAAPAATPVVRRTRTAPAFWLWPAFAGAAAAVVIAGLTQPPHRAQVDVSRRPALSIPSVTAPAPDIHHEAQPEPAAPRVAAQPAPPDTGAPQPATDPAAASPSAMPEVTRVASVSRPSRPASRGTAGDARAAASRGAVTSDPGEERVQPVQPDRDTASAPMMAEVPDAPADGDVDQPDTTEMAATVTPEATMRMAGFTPDAETSTGEDEGAQMLRMYLSERNRTVPQPPAVGMGRRRHSKPL